MATSGTALCPLEKVIKKEYNQTVMAEVIRVSGAREHNLKNISVEIPRD